MNVLFVCSRNRYRSPTAEAVFAFVEGIEVDSAGTADDAEQRVDAELLAWADLICVMEARHKRVLNRKFAQWLRGKRVVVLDIPDRFEAMDEELVALLQTKVTPFLRSPRLAQAPACDGTRPR